MIEIVMRPHPGSNTVNHEKLYDADMQGTILCTRRGVNGKAAEDKVRQELIGAMKAPEAPEEVELREGPDNLLCLTFTERSPRTFEVTCGEHGLCRVRADDAATAVRMLLECFIHELPGKTIDYDLEAWLKEKDNKNADQEDQQDQGSD